MEVLCCANLLPAAKNNRSDPYIICRVGERETRTKFILKTLNPVYKQVLDLPVLMDAPTSDAWTLILEPWNNGACSQSLFWPPCLRISG
jgi:Ca2+-dependent lipid-binding protein